MIKEIENHRSYRKYKTDPIAPHILEEIVRAASRASTVGNMQLYSIIVTTSPEVKQELSPCHFCQPMVVEAPAIMTFCADVRRFSLWCRQRGAQPGYDNLGWYLNAATDALLASQNASLEAEAHGLGICYLGTTLYTADRICEVLRLPEGVIPVMTVAMGYPAAEVPLTDRLPLRAVVHRNRYEDYTPELIDELWREREASEETQKLLKENDLPNLARIFTERRYKGGDNVAFSRMYLELLKKQGFLNQ